MAGRLPSQDERHISRPSAPKRHGWEDHKSGKPPFPGAAPPIHKQQGGKFVKKPKKK